MTLPIIYVSFTFRYLGACCPATTGVIPEKDFVMIENLSDLLGIEDLKEKNVGFRFLTRKGPNDSSAMMLFQWCLAPQFLAFLKENGVMNAKVFVVVTNPRGRAMRYIFTLSSPQELIEFHCSGEHKVMGTVVWGANMDRSCKRFLMQSYDRGQYDYDLESSFDYSKSFGLAEHSVDVADGFFAPEMSPLQDWWVNLWFDGQTWDECMIRRRKMVAYTIQPIVVGIFALILFIVRTIYAFWTGVLLLRKGVPWESLVRPFQYDTREIWDRSDRRWDSSNPMNLLVPIFFIPAIIILFGVMCLLYLAGHFIISLPLNWGLVFGGVGGCLAVWWGVAKLPKLLPKMVRTLRDATPEKVTTGIDRGIGNGMRMWDEWYSNRVKHSRAVHLERIYADLSCVTAPANGSVRTKRVGFTQNAVLAYHDVKARICRPTARR